MYFLNRLNEEELVVDFIKNPNNNKFKDNLRYINESNSRFLSNFFSISSTTVTCDACTKNSSVFEPSLLLSLSLRSDSKSSGPSKEEEILFFEQNKFSKGKTYDIPINSNSQKVYDVLDMMKTSNSQVDCSMFVCSRYSIKLIQRQEDLYHAKNLKESFGDSGKAKLVILGHNYIPRGLNVLELPFRITWQDQGKSLDFGYSLPLIVSKYNYDETINKYISEFEDELVFWQVAQETDQKAEVRVGVFGASKPAEDRCLVCKKVDCYNCYFTDKEGFNQLMDNKFRQKESSMMGDSNENSFYEEGSRGWIDDIRLKFYLSVHPGSLVEPKKESIPSMAEGSKRTESIEDLLTLFSTPETLKEEDKISCSHCNLKECSQKRTRLVHLPQILILHIKRFKYSGTQGLTKNNQLITFDELLNLAPFCDPPPDESFISDEEELVKKQSKVKQSQSYRLKAVINHQGSLSGGHYFSYVQEGDHWREFNDESVTEVSQSKLVSSKAYILIYERT